MRCTSLIIRVQCDNRRFFRSVLLLWGVQTVLTLLLSGQLLVLLVAEECVMLRIRIVTAAVLMLSTSKIWPIQLDDLLQWLHGSLGWLELSLVVGVRGVLLANELWDQLLDLVIVVEVLAHLVDNVFVGKATERIWQFVVVVFPVLALLECHISLQVSVTQLQQFVVLLQFTFVFLEQFVVEVLVVDCGIVHGDVEAGRLQFLVGCLLKRLQVFSY